MCVCDLIWGLSLICSVVCLSFQNSEGLRRFAVPHYLQSGKFLCLTLIRTLIFSRAPCTCLRLLHCNRDRLHNALILIRFCQTDVELVFPFRILPCFLPWTFSCPDACSFLQGHFHARLPVLFFRGIPMPGYLFFSQ